MPNKSHHSSPTPNDPPRRYLLPGALIALAIVVIALLVIARGADLTATSPPPVASPKATTTASTATTFPDTKTEVVTRLREILQIREQAFSERDASFLEDIYTSNCPCLQAGRDAIAALKKEEILWKDRSISIEVESAKSINKRLWQVVALFASNAFRIETEKGELVREAPPERIRYRFLLVRTSESELWRLGNASSIEG
jgi:hypothetical protein